MMEDRYLFKAKRIDDGEWAYGGYSYCEKDDTHFITTMCKDHISYIGRHQMVDPTTICQCTGLKDKNGKLIWENDIVEVPGENGYFIVGWQEDRASFVMDGDGLIADFDNYWSCDVWVIGDKFTNPDLLEVQE